MLLLQSMQSGRRPRLFSEKWNNHYIHLWTTHYRLNYFSFLTTKSITLTVGINCLKHETCNLCELYQSGYCCHLCCLKRKNVHSPYALVHSSCGYVQQCNRLFFRLCKRGLSGVLSSRHISIFWTKVNMLMTFFG